LLSQASVFLYLPDGRRAFLYQAVDPPRVGHGIYVLVVGEDQRRLLTVSSSSNPYPVYSPSGHIVYVDGTGDSIAIWALPFSLATFPDDGQSFPIAQHDSSPQVSSTDTLVYTDVPSDRMQLMWSDRSGKTLSMIGEEQRQSSPVLSPDGRKLPVEIGEGDPDIWVYDLDRGIKSRVTYDPAFEIVGR
jgi:Tol biopolymer transport system component